MSESYSFSDIKDQVVIITGSGRGIGKATAKLFAAQGAKVALTDLDEDVLQESLGEIQKEGGEAHAIVADVSKKEDAERLVLEVYEKWGKIDCLVNNAGITRDTLFIRMKPDVWQKVIDVNLGGTFYCSQAAVKYMRKARKGSIINFTSLARHGNPGQANYSAAKAGIFGLTKTLAMELGPMGIRVNCISPGFIETRLTDAIPDKIVEQFKSRIPLQRVGKPEEVAMTVLFLASKMSSYVSGIALDVTGGIGS